MATYVITHEVDDVEHWLSSPKREELFGPMGITVRTFRDPDGSNKTALIAEILELPHRSLRDVAPNVPEGLSVIVDRCLEKDRDKRYQTAAEIETFLASGEKTGRQLAESWLQALR